jgi:hypothetical protein
VRPRLTCSFGLGLLCIACGSGHRHSGTRAHGEPVTAADRKFSKVRWDTVWFRPGSERDTTLLLPTMIAADRRGVYALDIAGPRVVAFRATGGALEWMVGHSGGGPGEFRAPSSLSLTADGSIVVTDARGARLSVFRADGTLKRTIPLGEEPNTLRTCALSPGQFLVKQLVDGTPPIAQIDTDGVVGRRYALPWGQLRKLSSIVGQVELVPGEDAPVCMMATIFGPGFAIVDSGGIGAVHPYVESFAPPDVIASPDHRSFRLKDRRIAALSVAEEHDTIAVLFEGLTRDRDKLLDFYRMGDGAYLGSVRLPHREKYMALADGTYYFLDYRDGLYDLVAARMVFEGSE